MEVSNAFFLENGRIDNIYSDIKFSKRENYDIKAKQGKCYIFERDDKIEPNNYDYINAYNFYYMHNWKNKKKKNREKHSE